MPPTDLKRPLRWSIDTNHQIINTSILTPQHRRYLSPDRSRPIDPTLRLGK
ncbi:MAG: hypothetical protein HC795_18850 [Coleofasciculaceae cyanobacterium RL_1_1]|nr:hypothetical protein [Coleofasciculaceae cyanobacterium RL_1_1]